VDNDGSRRISEKGAIYISQRMCTVASARWYVSQQYPRKGKLMKELKSRNSMALIDVQRLWKDDTLEDWLKQEVDSQLDAP